MYNLMEDLESQDGKSVPGQGGDGNSLKVCDLQEQMTSTRLYNNLLEESEMDWKEKKR